MESNVEKVAKAAVASEQVEQTAAVETAPKPKKEKKVKAPKAEKGLTDKQKQSLTLTAKVAETIQKRTEAWTVRDLFTALNEKEAQVRNVVMKMVKEGTVAIQPSEKKRYTKFLKV